MSTDVILVPGFWLGAWAWEAVADALRSKGLGVVALTLPGLESTESDRSAVTMDDHVAAVVEALRSSAADRRVLTVHSGAALPGSAAMDRVPELIDHVVWVDTWPLPDGMAMNPDFAAAEYPLPSWEDLERDGNSLDGLGTEVLDQFRRRAVPQPAASLREPIHLHNPARLEIPTTMVCASATSEQVHAWLESGAPIVQALRDHRVTYVDLPTGHWPMWSKAKELADVIAAV